MKKIFIVGFAVLSAVMPLTASAQSSPFYRNLSFGAYGEDVRVLQGFLNDNGYLTVAPSGYYGKLTQTAVRNWQRDNGLPAVGNFGQLSRAKYYAIITANGGSNNDDVGTTPVPPVTTPAPYLSYFGSSTMKQGEVIYLYGTNLPYNFSVYVDGSGVDAEIIYRSSTAISFRLPSWIGAGSHSLRISGEKSGSPFSNLITFTLTASTPTLSLTSVMPALATPGTIVSVYGSGFNYATFGIIDGNYGYTIQPSAITVYQGGSQLTFILPTGLSYGNHSLQVAEKAGSALSNTINFTVGASTTSQTNPVVISSFTASASSINPGGAVTFTWSSNLTQNDISYQMGGCSIQGLSQNNVQLYVAQAGSAASGQVTYYPPATATYTLFCSSGGKDGSPSAMKQVTVSVASQATVSAPTVVRTNSMSILSVSAGANAARIAAFSVNTGSAINISSLKFAKYNSAVKLQNVKVYVNGAQFGMTRTTPAPTETMYFSSATPVAIGQYSSATVDVYADVLSTTAGGTYYDAIEFPGWGATYVSNGAEVNFPYTVVGQDLFVAAPVTAGLTPAANAVFAGPTYTPGASGVKLASFTATASTASAVGINSLTFDKDYNGIADIQNFKVMVGGNQIGATLSNLADTEPFITVNSMAGAITVPAGSSVVIDLYGDLLSTSLPSVAYSLFDFSGWSAVSSMTGSAIAFPGAVNGQDVYISSSPTLTLATASNTAPSKNVSMGSGGTELVSFRTYADSIDDVRITDVNVTDVVAGTVAAASFQNFTLWDGSSMVAGPTAVVVHSDGIGRVHFVLYGNGITVPKNSSKTFTVKADVASSNTGSAVVGSTHSFILNIGDITARTVNNTGSTVTVTGMIVLGNMITVTQ